jgi:DNA mismatch repair ATPase MutS
MKAIRGKKNKFATTEEVESLENAIAEVQKRANKLENGFIFQFIEGTLI